MTGVIELSAPTAEHMRDLASAIASLLAGGDVVVLTGDLGAGKTTFGRGAGAAVGALGRADVVVEACVVIVLGIDTATRQTSVALGTERGPTAQMALSVARSHEEIVAPAIQQLLTWSDMSLSQLGGIAVGIGPGLFTGLRVGVETARTLAQVLSAPI